jgi:hypothetical protein
METTIRSIEWKRLGSEGTIDVTDAIEKGVVSATPHPDDDIDRPKGYTVKLVLKPESTEWAEDLQAALMDVEPAELTLWLEDAETPVSEVPVRVSKVPYPGEQNVAELSVKPEGHDKLHEHFGAA